jgi:hypothetical protein
MKIPAYRKTRMISVRLSPGEYETLAKLCPELGVRGISDIARIALQQLAAKSGGSDPLAFEVRDIRSQLKVMVDEVDRIADIVETRTAVKAGLD